MKYTERAVIAVFSLIGSVAATWLLVIAVTYLFDSNGWTRLTASDWGTWVGAIGTVGALIGAIWIATKESRERRSTEQALAIITASKILLLTYALREQLRLLVEALQVKPFDFVNFPFAKYAMALRHFETFETEDLVRLAALPNNVGAKLAAANTAILTISKSLEISAIRPPGQPEDFRHVDALLTHALFAKRWLDDAHEQIKLVSKALDFAAD